MSDRLLAVVHADESCLGNGMEPPNPGGASCLIETRARNNPVMRRDLFISSPDTTNNRMALSGAIACLALLGRKGKSVEITYVSDSKYLVHGMREWAPAWQARGWTRKRGTILNLELWKELMRQAGQHRIGWEWVQGHAEHPKNEYANWLAIKAAQQQTHSRELEESRFDGWLSDQRAKGKYRDYDPDAEL